MHTISSVLNTIESGDYAFKIDLQNAYFHVLIQHEVPELCLRKQGISVPSTSLPSEHCPEGTYSSGAQSGSLPPSSGDIDNSISPQLANTQPRPSSFTTLPVSVAGYTERSKIQTESSSGYTVSGASIMCGSGESFPPNIQGSGDNSTCVPKILPNSFVAQRSVPVHGITQLGLRSYPTGSVTHEALTTTFSFVRFDKPVYTCADKTL